jgi:hypothetical protein
MERHIFTTRDLFLIPHSACERSAIGVKWQLNSCGELMLSQYGRRQAFVKIHSHPNGYDNFSDTDDINDKRLLPGFSNFYGDELPHGSAVMQPDGRIFGRVWHKDAFHPFSNVAVIGHDIKFWPFERPVVGEASHRQVQAFGRGTTELLRSLSVGVVGCSGTGSFTVEQVARLGFRRIVLVDPDKVEEKNLNRIVNASKRDAYLGNFKVDVLASAIARIGLDQEVLPIAKNLITKESVRALAECDILFGCMDGVEGRHFLNRLATFYLIPYFDMGVKLTADGAGGISGISGTSHYLQPGKSSLLSRGMYEMEQVGAEGLHRTNPDMYAQQQAEGYIRGIVEDRPAVITVNALQSALSVNDFLARLHPYRNLDNRLFAEIACNLNETQLFLETEDAHSPCENLRQHVGRGDVTPLLERSALS